MATAEIGVFGGSGLYELLEDAEEVEVDTPYGAPSAPATIGSIGGKRVAFIPRHGRRHEYPAHRVPYRANVWAMRELGARRVIGPCAVGSLAAAVPRVDPELAGRFGEQGAQVGAASRSRTPTTPTPSPQAAASTAGSSVS